MQKTSQMPVFIYESALSLYLYLYGASLRFTQFLKLPLKRQDPVHKYGCTRNAKNSAWDLFTKHILYTHTLLVEHHKNIYIYF